MQISANNHNFLNGFIKNKTSPKLKRSYPELVFNFSSLNSNQYPHFLIISRSSLIQAKGVLS